MIVIRFCVHKCNIYGCFLFRNFLFAIHNMDADRIRRSLFVCRSRHPSSIGYFAFNRRSIVLYDFENPRAKHTVRVRCYTDHWNDVTTNAARAARVGFNRLPRAETCEVCSYSYYWNMIFRRNMIVWITSVTTFPTKTHVNVHNGGVPRGPNL